MVKDLVRKHNQSLYEYRRTSHNYSENAKRRGEKLSKFDTANFLAWDGEGTQKRKKQVYSLLANSNGDYLIDVEGLSTEDCLEFLTSDRYPDNTIHVCFGSSYDTNMFMRDIPEYMLRQLYKGKEKRSIRWYRYDIEYRSRKCFTVRRLRTEERNGKEYFVFDEKTNRYIYDKCIVLWDVFGFFSKKFVKVLQEWFANTEYEEKYKHVIEDIIFGKQKRGEFKAEELETFVLPYCLNECYALKDLMTIFHGYINQAGLKLSRWDGAGSVAAAMLKKHGIKEHIRIGDKLQYEPYPQCVIDAAESAYFGGWIEAFMFGHFDMPVYHYDLRSAYPSVIETLPSMVQGTWKTLFFGNKLPLSEILETIEQLPSMWLGHIEWQNGPMFGPCPFSWRNKLGAVTRPIRGAGWQWSCEIMAAYRHFPQMDFKIDCIHYFIPDEYNEKPFAFVREYYNLRNDLKKRGIGMEKVYKLGLNSIYGKLAQSLGYNEERKLKPPFHCIIYAGWITSLTRAKILDAVMQAPLSIISIATDGIYSLKPLNVDIGDDLGQWEYTLHDNMTVVQPGFYWFSTQGVESHYYRGFNENCITRQQVIDAYRNNQESITLLVTRFITLGAAIGLNDFSCWRTWRTKERVLDLVLRTSQKRIWDGLMFDKDIRIARNKIYNPRLFEMEPGLLESKKYSFEWAGREDGWDGLGQRELVEEMYHQELSPD